MESWYQKAKHKKTTGGFTLSRYLDRFSSKGTLWLEGIQGKQESQAWCIDGVWYGVYTYISILYTTGKYKIF